MQPTIENLRNVIRKGDDSHDNVLILNLDGSFELIPGGGTGAIKEVKGSNYVAKLESFDSGNDYVGVEASKDDKHIQFFFDMACRLWDDFQERGTYPITNLYL